MFQYTRILIIIGFIFTLLINYSGIVYAQQIARDSVIQLPSDTMVIEETIYEYDTIFVPGDTIHYDPPADKKSKLRGTWSSSLKLSFYKSFFDYSSSNSVPVGFDYSRSKPSGGRELCLGIRYNTKPWFFESGLFIGSFDDFLYHNRITVELDTVRITPYYSDTFNIFLDGAWVTVFVEDTLYETEPKTVIKSTEIQYRFSYVDVPILAGYSIKKRKIEYKVTAGLLPGIITKPAYRKRLNESPENSNLLAPEEYFRKFCLQGLIAGEINVHFYDSMRFVVGGFYRRNLLSGYKSSVGAKKFFNGTGITIGLEYVFK